VALAGKRVVVVGGTSGIGLATAQRLVAVGAEVIIAGRTEERLERAKVKIGGALQSGVLDVRKEDEVREFFAGIGHFDHLTTPGTEGVVGPIAELDSARARAGFDSKFWGQWMAAKYAVPWLRTRGSIVFVAGIYGQRPPAGVSTLAAINSAVEGLARGLAVELAPLRVNAISPGTLDTPIYDKMAPEVREEMYRTTAASLLVGRIGTAEEAAKAIIYLMDNGFVTGQTLFVDGGRTLS
jgi:NAD(P)-dependent dehydrogenase (short-subunit alcohol dehydrogenase family)